MSRPRDEWKQDVMGRYKALAQFSKEDARVQYLRIIRSLPYGGWVGGRAGAARGTGTLALPCPAWPCYSARLAL